MLQDGLHCVSRLLTRDSKEFLQWPRNVRENRLGSFVWIHGTGWACNKEWHNETIFLGNYCALHYIIIFFEFVSHDKAQWAKIFKKWKNQNSISHEKCSILVAISENFLFQKLQKWDKIVWILPTVHLCLVSKKLIFLHCTYRVLKIYCNLEHRKRS